MSKYSLFPVGLCTLLGACAFNTASVIAQTPAPESGVAPTQNTAINNVAPPAVSPPNKASSPALPPATESTVEPEITGEITPPTPTVVETPAVPTPPPLPPCPQGSDRLATQICERIRAESSPTHMTMQGHSLHAVDATRKFYAQRDYRAAWFGTEGRPSAMVEALLQSISEADAEGLHSSDYRPDVLRKQLKAFSENGRGYVADDTMRAEYDVLLTDTYLTYGTHLLAGRFLPRKVDPDWAIKPRTRDMVATLQSALDTQNISASLKGLVPQNKGYLQLRETLHHYRAVAQKGGWPMITGSGAVLCDRLRDTGDLGSGSCGSLTEAVRRFQKRHGLVESGTLDIATRAALNVPIATRIRQIELNLERFRWLPDDFGSRYILVNIPSFKMKVIEDGRAVIEANVVVGRQERQTPTFNANMAYVVLSPTWSVPRSIALKDKLPQLRRSPYALARQNIRVLNSAGHEINPGSVNWGAVNDRNFNYLFRQDAGPRNALGGIKFMFPNPYNVYLHDTPSRELFKRTQRTFSSGCIRISNPVELATYLLKFDPKWTRDAIQRASTSGQQRVVNLREPMPVYLLYWTTWVDENGLVHFRDDIYQRDKPMIRALFGAPESKV